MHVWRGVRRGMRGTLRDTVRQVGRAPQNRRRCAGRAWPSDSGWYRLVPTPLSRVQIGREAKSAQNGSPERSCPDLSRFDLTVSFQAFTRPVAATPRCFRTPPALKTILSHRDLYERLRGHQFSYFKSQFSQRLVGLRGSWPQPRAEAKEVTFERSAPNAESGEYHLSLWPYAGGAAPPSSIPHAFADPTTASTGCVCRSG